MSQSSSSERTGDRVIGVRVDDELHREIRVEAAKRDMTMAEYARGLFLDDLEELEDE